MTWHYGTRLHFSPYPEVAIDLPPPGSAYLAWDALREAVVIGYTERGGYSSILRPNVDDDCLIVAWAPLSETSDPDPELIPLRAEQPYRRSEIPRLVRGEVAP
jgi:hypothetical protein